MVYSCKHDSNHAYKQTKNYANIIIGMVSLESIHIIAKLSRSTLLRPQPPPTYPPGRVYFSTNLYRRVIKLKCLSQWAQPILNLANQA
jgi:hypothetical protein